MAIWADCVICDYNYAFDPRVYLKRFFQDNDKNYVFLVDEAHNLVDRAREMFSAELYKKDFLELKKLLGKEAKQVVKALNKINSYFVAVKKECGEKETMTQTEEPKDIFPLLHGFLHVTEKWFLENHTENSQLLDVFFKVYQFVKISEYYSNDHVTYGEVLGSDVKLKMFCLNPATLLKEAINRANGTIFFSATLSPMEYYKDLLGGEEGDYVLSLSSPFDKENMLVMADKNISTYYKDREENYLKIADTLYQFISGKKGNYFAFFPSYSFMNRVFDTFEEKYPGIETFIQTGHMDEREREDFLEKLQPQKEQFTLAFGVLGGIFSEGIDLVGDRLIGAAIVGVGLPQMCLERDLIMEHFNKQNLGFEYSYMYPGFNKVLQGGGRVIRSENDKGVILLIDKRYNSFRYRNLFPVHWSGLSYITREDELKGKLQGFWDESHGK